MVKDWSATTHRYPSVLLHAHSPACLPTLPSRPRAMRALDHSAPLCRDPQSLWSSTRPSVAHTEKPFQPSTSSSLSLPPSCSCLTQTPCSFSPFLCARCCCPPQLCRAGSCECLALILAQTPHPSGCLAGTPNPASAPCRPLSLGRGSYPFPTSKGPGLSPPRTGQADGQRCPSAAEQGGGPRRWDGQNHQRGYQYRHTTHRAPPSAQGPDEASRGPPAARSGAVPGGAAGEVAAVAPGGAQRPSALRPSAPRARIPRPFPGGPQRQ